MIILTKTLITLGCLLSVCQWVDAQEQVSSDTTYLPKHVPRNKATSFVVVKKEDSVHYRINMYLIDGRPFFSSSVKPTLVNGVPSGDILMAQKDGHFYNYKLSTGTVNEEGMHVNGVRAGEWREYDENQVVKAKKFYSDSARLLKVVNYDKNGMKVSEGTKVPSKGFASLYQMDGLWKIYYANSEDLAVVKFFKRSDLDGPFGRYDRKTHKKIEKGQYKDNKKVGTWETYDPVSDQLRSTVNYIDGKAEGEFLLYNRLGGIRLKGVFKNGLREGTWKQYYEDSSKLEGLFEYHHDIAKTTWYDSATGAVRTTGGVKAMEFHGKFTQYFIGTTKIRSEFTYVDGLMEGIGIDYDSDGKIVEQGKFVHGKKHGPHKYNYEHSNKRWMELNFENDTLHGYLKVLYRNGELKRYSQYKNGDMVSEKCFSESGEAIQCPPIKTNATFNGDVMTYIGNSLVYPEDAKEVKAEGKVMVSFTVNENGSVSNPRVVKGFNESCDNEALRIISEMPRWIPAQIDGHAFSQRKTLPVVFWLNGAE